ncbi:MAG: hypothetical protein U0W24_05720 [Bacteroidales bacterium]
MKAKVFIVSILLIFCNLDVLSQQYSFSTFAFKLYDNHNIILSFGKIDGFNHYFGTKVKIDTASQFEIFAPLLSDDLNYQHLAPHKPGIWILFAENFKKWRPLRLLGIRKIMPDGKIEEMILLLNYDYQSCEMPCTFGQSEFKTSELVFRKGTFILTGITEMKDWNKNSDKIIEVNCDILKFLTKYRIILWDNERTK